MLGIATNQFASFCLDIRSRQCYFRVCQSAEIWNKKAFFPFILTFLLCKTNRFHVAVRLFSNRSQWTSKCGKKISDTLGCDSCATFLFLPHYISLYKAKYFLTVIRRQRPFNQWNILRPDKNFFSRRNSLLRIPSGLQFHLDVAHVTV